MNTTVNENDIIEQANLIRLPLDIERKYGYAKVSEFVHDLARVKSMDNKWGVVDIFGKIIVPIEYDFIFPLKKLEPKHITARRKSEKIEIYL